ncbi:kinase-like domain-containing protein [Mycena floridula]|nr:kinase-like domain-containing protein [Mycena floridula]
MTTLPPIETTEQALHQLSYALDDVNWKNALKFLKKEYHTLGEVEKARVDEQIWNGVFIHGYYPADIDLTDDISFSITGGNREQLGRGAAGTVYAATLHNRAVAVKILNRDGDAVKESFFREIQKWRTIQHHENVLPFIGYIFKKNDEIGLVSPLAEEGDLSDWIKNHPDTSDRDRYRLIDGIAQGLSHLHNHIPVVVHGDLRASNVFLMKAKGGHMTVKIGDFGISKLGESEGSMTIESQDIRSSLNVRWLASELMENSYAPRTKSTDLFAFARTITEIFSGNIPFIEIPKEDIQNYVRHGGIPIRPDGIHNSVWDIMLRYWSQNPNERGTAALMSDCIRDHELASAMFTLVDDEPGDLELLPKNM